MSLIHEFLALFHQSLKLRLSLSLIHEFLALCSSVSEIEVGFVVNPRIPCSVASVPEVEVEFVVNPLTPLSGSDTSSSIFSLDVISRIVCSGADSFVFTAPNFLCSGCQVERLENFQRRNYRHQYQSLCFADLSQ